MIEDIRAGSTRRRFLRNLGIVGAAFGAGCSREAGNTGRKSPTKTTAASHADATSPSLDSEDTREGQVEKTTSIADGAGESFVYSEAIELRAIKRKAGAGEDPWATAVRELLKNTRENIDKPLRSVVDDGASGSRVDNPHKFASGGKTDRHDYLAARQFSARTRDVALAYQLTGDDRYAERTVESIKYWTTESGTAMYPDVLNYIDIETNSDWGYPPSVELNITLPNFYYAASMVRSHPAWNGGEAAFEHWTRKTLDELEGWAGKEYPNPVVGNNTNMRGSYVQHRAATASYLGDSDALDRAVNWFKEHAIYDVDDDGSLPRELKRSEGLDYSLNALQAFTSMAEIARHKDIDLYSWSGPGNYDGGKPVLEAIADYTAPYVANPNTWPHDGGGGRPRTYMDNGGIYEVLHSRFHKPKYLKAVEAMGRPIRSGDYLGPLTATHANLHELVGK